MMRSRSATLPALALAAALFAAAGCGPNGAGTLVAPTGSRPAHGSVAGVVLYDTLNTPDLRVPPYPPTVVELWDDGARLASRSLPAAERTFRFEGLGPGYYHVVVRTNMFYAYTGGRMRLNESDAYAGNILLRINPLATAAGIEIIGTMPGFRVADLYEYMFPIDVTGMSSSALGVWDFPSLDYPDGLPIPAGLHRFKFATLFPASATNLTGWGNVLGDTLTPPVVHHPTVQASGAATDIVMNFPTAGYYTFRLDERRQTFSVAFAHASPALPARLVRR